MHIRPTGHGFTLLELLMAVAIVAVVSAIGVPSYAAFMQDRRVATTVDLLISAHTFARGEAVKLGLPVWICAVKTQGGRDCSTKDWSQGWEVFVSAAGASPDALRLWVNDPLVSVSAAQATHSFLSSGWLVDSSQSPANGWFEVKSGGQCVDKIKILASGLARKEAC